MFSQLQMKKFERIYVEKLKLSVFYFFIKMKNISTGSCFFSLAADLLPYGGRFFS